LNILGTCMEASFLFLRTGYDKDPPDADNEARARCSGAAPGGSIFRSPSSPMAKVNDPKVS
jgi:hypothetical protein